MPMIVFVLLLMAIIGVTAKERVRMTMRMRVSTLRWSTVSSIAESVVHETYMVVMTAHGEHTKEIHTQSYRAYQ